MYDFFQGSWSVIPQSPITPELTTAHVLPSVHHPGVTCTFHVHSGNHCLLHGPGDYPFVFYREFFFFFKGGSMPNAELNAEFELTTLRSRLELRSRVRGLTD